MDWIKAVAGWGVATLAALVCLNFAFGAIQALVGRIRRDHRPSRFAGFFIVLWLCFAVGLVMSAWSLATGAALGVPVLLAVGQRLLDFVLWPSLLGLPWIMRLLRSRGGFPDVEDAG